MICFPLTCRASLRLVLPLNFAWLTDVTFYSHRTFSHPFPIFTSSIFPLPNTSSLMLLSSFIVWHVVFVLGMHFVLTLMLCFPFVLFLSLVHYCFLFYLVSSLSLTSSLILSHLSHIFFPLEFPSHLCFQSLANAFPLELATSFSIALCPYPTCYPSHFL